MSARAIFVKTETRKAGMLWDTMQQASTHDPDHEKEIKELRMRIEVLERQMERLGAPQYRRVK